MICAVFLDRDGTVIEEPDDEVVDLTDKVRVLPSVIPALNLLIKNGYMLFFITNQIGINQGRITHEKFYDINNFILKLLNKEGISVTDTFLCPHSPKDNCNCRKPKPGLILQAISKYEIDTKRSFIIGDRKSDIGLGKTTGIKTVFVKTGFDKSIGNVGADYVAEDLLDAARFITNSIR